MMDKCLVMSNLAKRELARQNIESTFLPVALDTTVDWSPPLPDERKNIRKALGFGDDEFVVLTVADNQERKNLSAAMETFSKFCAISVFYDESGYALNVETVRKARYVMITRVNPDPPVGYDLTDLAMRYGILDKVEFVERGIPTEELKLYYAAADAFLLTSKAEGLAIPQLEAMAMELPVVVTGATAMLEHVDSSGCGFPVPVDYKLIDPFGNEERHLINTDAAADALRRIDDGDGKKQLKAGREYVEKRNWNDVAEIVAKAVKEVRNG